MKLTSVKGRVNKGAPSGFVVSLIFHAAAFFIAGLFVVFTVLPKENSRKFYYRIPEDKYVPLIDFYLGDWKGDKAHSRRGRKYKSYLVTVSDKNGNLIAYQTPTNGCMKTWITCRSFTLETFLTKNVCADSPIRPRPLRNLNF